jgi:hypothetical protein
MLLLAAALGICCSISTFASNPLQSVSCSRYGRALAFDNDSVATQQIERRITSLQKSLSLLQTQIQGGSDTGAILSRAGELVKSAKKLHADLVRDCLAQVLATPQTSTTDTKVIVAQLSELLR